MIWAAAVAVAGGLVACGDAADRAATAASPTASPPTGRLVQVGAQRIFLDCQGAGPGPVVVLDAGLGNASAGWVAVQRQVATGARVCRWDRPGLGSSPPGPKPRDSRVIATELRALLTAAGVEGPYLLVGASFGGLNTQYHARTWPAEVAGVVLVDSTHPDLDRQIVEIGAEDGAERAATLSRNQEQIGYDDLLRSDEQVRAAPDFPPVPLYVLRHGVNWDVDPDFRASGAEGLWGRLQADLAAQSPCSRQLTVTGTSHRIHEQRPDVVAAAIRSVLAAAAGRSGGCRPPEPVPG